MRDCLHSMKEDDVIRVNGVEYVVNCVIKNDDELKLSVILYSGIEIVSTPRNIQIYHPNTDDLFSSKFDVQSVTSVRMLDECVD